MRKRYGGFLFCCANSGEKPESYEWFCANE